MGWVVKGVNINYLCDFCPFLVLPAIAVLYAFVCTYADRFDSLAACCLGCCLRQRSHDRRKHTTPTVGGPTSA